jgi:hypothetical protein
MARARRTKPADRRLLEQAAREEREGTELAAARDALANLRSMVPTAQQALIETLSQWEGDPTPLTRLAAFLELCDSELGKGGESSKTESVQVSQ